MGLQYQAGSLLGFFLTSKWEATAVSKIIILGRIQAGINWHDPRWDPAWEVFSRVGICLKLQRWDPGFDPTWDVLSQVGNYQEFKAGSHLHLAGSHLGSQVGSRQIKVGSHSGHIWDPSWDWRDPTLYFYLGNTEIKESHFL